MNELSSKDLFSSYIAPVFYTRLKSLYFLTRQSASQAGQDFWVYGEVFNQKQDGYFVEIGSADGVTFSNTFLLEKKYQWRGICIEASPSYFELLKSIRNATCLNICVDSEEGEVVFSPQGLFGGIVDEDTDNRDAEFNKDLIKIKTRPLVSILMEYNAPKVIDYLSIDVEGAEDRILCEFPFDEYRFNCLTIERPSSKLREILRLNGYILIKEIPHLDSFYVHKLYLDNYKINAFDFWQKYRHSFIRM